MSAAKYASRDLAGREFLALEAASLRLRGSVVFGRTNWTWRKGEQWGMLGPDGAGKSLLIEALLGRVPLATGDLRGPHATGKPAAEEPVAHLSPLTQRRLALQESSFYQSRWHSGIEEGQRTVAQFLSQESVEDRNPFEVGAHGFHRGQFLRRRNQLVRWLCITALLPRKLVQLSNGELRRTLLVHVLLRASRLLILEDPFTGLDAPARGVLRRVIGRVMRAGTPVLVATNRADEIPRPTTHLLIVDRHRVVAQGPKSRLLRFWQERFGAPADAAGVSSRNKARVSSPGCRRVGGRPIVEFQSVTIMNGPKCLLRDVTWTLHEGECWALSGRNGAGKTTLLNLIQGDHPQAYAQSIRLFGRKTDSTKTLWQMRQRLGWMSPELHQHYPTEWAALSVVCSGFFNTVGLHESPSRTQLATARKWLGDLGLAAHAGTPFGELTFGHQRLVLLARAVVKRPRLLILDEPCQGLDAAQRRTVLAAVDRVVARTATSLIFVTHHAKEIPRCITHALHLKRGRVQEAAPVG